MFGGCCIGLKTGWVVFEEDVCLRCVYKLKLECESHDSTHHRRLEHLIRPSQHRDKANDHHCRLIVRVMHWTTVEVVIRMVKQN